ncbi:hypothetical protein [Halorubrum aethiopicum]|uniref:hypothetical protein n=1 Tax=Halorubrum aethiopicum TaxID=1758255 RepID=UPI00082DBA51|nr:hypothetical protein [Halorubrum aethiopicum]
MTEPDSETDSLPREDVTVGTICEYTRDGADDWVIVVREPRSIREYADSLGDRSPPEGWADYDADETDVIHFIPLDGKDDVIARLEGSGLEGHQEVATDLYTRSDSRPLVGALPDFDVLGPTEAADPVESLDMSPEDRHVE